MVSDTLWVHRHLCFIHSYAKIILALPWIGQKKWKAKIGWLLPGNTPKNGCISSK